MTKRQTNRDRLYALMSDNHGVITLESAAAAGVPAVEVRKLAARGALERVGRGVYLIPFAPVNKFQAAVAVLDSVAPDAYLVGRSVLSLLDIGLEMPFKYEVFVPRRTRRKLPSAVVLTKMQLGTEFEVINGVRCEPVFKILQQRVQFARPDRVERELDDALAGLYISSFEFDELHRQFDLKLAKRE